MGRRRTGKDLRVGGRGDERHAATRAPADPPAPRAYLLLAGLSLALPGLGQLVRGRVTTGLLFLAGVLLPYVAFLVLLNDRYGFRGEILSFSFDSARGPLRPPAEHWALLVLGVALHLLSVWDAGRRCTTSATV